MAGRASFSWPLDDKPVSVSSCEAAVILLDRPLLTGSSDLPGSGNGAGRSSSPIWSCSTWGLPCRTNYSARGALLPHHFTLTGRSRRYIFCGTFRKIRLNGSPRPLAGMLPFGDRTFLQPAFAHQPATACPKASPDCLRLKLPQTILEVAPFHFDSCVQRAHSGGAQPGS